MQREDKYAKLFREAEEIYISDDKSRVYNLMATDYLTATKIQVYEFESRKRTFIEFQSSYYKRGICYWSNGEYHENSTLEFYYYPEFISIYVENGQKFKEVGSGANLSEEIRKEMVELITEKFDDVNMYLTNFDGKCKKHRTYEFKPELLIAQ